VLAQNFVVRVMSMKVFLIAAHDDNRVLVSTASWWPCKGEVPGEAEMQHVFLASL
jgi:hypothetical protein